MNNKKVAYNKLLYNRKSQIIGQMIELLFLKRFFIPSMVEIEVYTSEKKNGRSLNSISTSIRRVFLIILIQLLFSEFDIC